jgi:altronate hydrolase
METLDKKYCIQKQLVAPEIFELPEKILQFGTGVLLRGLCDYLVDKANRKGIFNGRIVVVKSTDGGDASAFDVQDNLYTLSIRGIEKGKRVEENVVCSAISRVIAAKNQWKMVLDCAKNPDLQIIISNTTESGIQLEQDNIHENPPTSFPGKVLAFLYARYNAFQGDKTKGMVIVPTELITENGKKLENIVLELAHLNGLDTKFIDWLEHHNSFCNSLVDRIVPGKPDSATKTQLTQQLGYKDDLLITSEPYLLWAIEGDKRVKSVLSFAKTDKRVIIQPNIDLYRELKLRMLNGTHTLSCGVAFLSGFSTVKEAMQDETMSEFIRKIMLHEISEGIPYPIVPNKILSFGNDVLDRFRNPFIDHLWWNITLNYSSKMSMRNVPTLAKYVETHQKTPDLFAFGFAAYLLFMRGAHPQAIQDSNAAYFSELWANHAPEQIVKIALQNKILWDEDLTQFNGFSEKVIQHLQDMLKIGVKNALNQLIHPQKQVNNVLKVHPNDNVIVALSNLLAGETVVLEGEAYLLLENIAAKHKFAAIDFLPNDIILMYGVLVGKAQNFIPRGTLLTTSNVKHATNPYQINDERKLNWHIPDISKWQNRTFNGYHRADGSVGTGNYWLVIPLVFCENRNMDVLRDALVKDLGYGRQNAYQTQTLDLIELIKKGKSPEEILKTDVTKITKKSKQKRLFKNIDGIKFLSHDGGCGGTRQDAQTLCGLLAGYITHSNVAGATILSLGCQNAQVSMLQAEIKKRDADFKKPLFVLEQQQIGTEEALITQAIKQTLVGLMQANENTRRPAPLSQLCIGLECGGSDGFSGISANPAIGYTSDLLVALGGTVILSEFPELCGVEQELCDRCADVDAATRFASLMKTYNERAKSVGSGFDMNPSPGNIKDGLITDAIKSAGAAKKGGTSPIVAVLDYPEKVTKSGLNLLCTPGNDVESTTAEVGSGANIVLFTTGLGTPTGNPITPVIKLSSNTKLAEKMPDIIDINTGTITEGKETIVEAGERILEYIIQVASGTVEISAVRHGQDDFIPWKRGVSL